MTFNKKLKGFTLIEMLIVIVIIGVLAAALIPRFTSVRGRANDVARRADVHQLATAVITFQMDNNGTLPDSGTGNGASVETIAGQLAAAGMDGVPVDPLGTTATFRLANGATITGSYGYLRIRKDGIDNAGFLLMAKTQTPGGSNRLVEPTIAGVTGGHFTSLIDANNITPCPIIRKVDTVTDFSNPNNGTNCEYNEASQLYYIMVR